MFRTWLLVEQYIRRTIPKYLRFVVNIETCSVRVRYKYDAFQNLHVTSIVNFYVFKIDISRFSLIQFTSPFCLVQLLI